MMAGNREASEAACALAAAVGAEHGEDPPADTSKSNASKIAFAAYLKAALLRPPIRTRVIGGALGLLNKYAKKGRPPRP